MAAATDQKGQAPGAPIWTIQKHPYWVVMMKPKVPVSFNAAVQAALRHDEWKTAKTSIAKSGSWILNSESMKMTIGVHTIAGKQDATRAFDRITVCGGGGQCALSTLTDRVVAIVGEASDVAIRNAILTASIPEDLGVSVNLTAVESDQTFASRMTGLKVPTGLMLKLDKTVTAGIFTHGISISGCKTAAEATSHMNELTQTLSKGFMTVKAATVDDLAKRMALVGLGTTVSGGGAAAASSSPSSQPQVPGVPMPDSKSAAVTVPPESPGFAILRKFVDNFKHFTFQIPEQIKTMCIAALATQMFGEEYTDTNRVRVEAEYGSLPSASCALVTTHNCMAVFAVIEANCLATFGGKSAAFTPFKDTGAFLDLVHNYIDELPGGAAAVITRNRRDLTVGNPFGRLCSFRAGDVSACRGFSAARVYCYCVEATPTSFFQSQILPGLLMKKTFTFITAGLGSSDPELAFNQMCRTKGLDGRPAFTWIRVGTPATAAVTAAAMADCD